MFSKAEKSRAQTARPSDKPAAPSIISENLTVTGNLVSEGDIQIDGTIDGDVRSKRLTIGQSAVINGAVMGDNVRIAGTVNGEITAKKVELTETARVTGDIVHDSLAIDAGAYVQGLCRRVEAQRLELAKSGDTVTDATAALPKLTVAESKPGQPEKKAG